MESEFDLIIAIPKILNFSVRNKNLGNLFMCSTFLYFPHGFLLLCFPLIILSCISNESLVCIDYFDFVSYYCTITR